MKENMLLKSPHYLKFQVLTAMNMKIAAFRDMTPCNLVAKYVFMVLRMEVDDR
jgi:hypothetical protein